MNKLRGEAEKLRDSGYSYSMIKDILGISKSTLSNWFSNRPFTPNKEVLKRIQYGPIKSGAKKHNEKVKNIEELKQLGIKEVGKLSRRDLWMIGIGLYIGEGSKSMQTTRIVNSNPKVIKFAIRWFKEICGIKSENLSIAIHLYPNSNIDRALKFWSKITEIPISRFRET